MHQKEYYNLTNFRSSYNLVFRYFVLNGMMLLAQISYIKWRDNKRTIIILVHGEKTDNYKNLRIPIR